MGTTERPILQDEIRRQESVAKGPNASATTRDKDGVKPRKPVPSPGDSFAFHAHPPLKRWAIIFRARGAGATPVRPANHIPQRGMHTRISHRKVSTQNKARTLRQAQGRLWATGPYRWRRLWLCCHGCFRWRVRGWRTPGECLDQPFQEREEHFYGVSHQEGNRQR